MIIAKSKKETKQFRFVLFGNQFSLWLAQLYWALFLNTEGLFPFPAFYSRSLFATWFSTHSLFYIWLVFLTLFAVFLVALLIVRHRMVVRDESLFNCPTWFYVGMLLGGWALGVALLLGIWRYSYSSEGDQFLFVEKNFPECIQIFSLPGVLVLTDLNGIYALLAVFFLTGLSAEVVYIIASFIALFELSQQTRKMSIGTLHHHKKIVIDTTVQILIKSIFMSTWSFWLVASYFIDKSVDTRAISTVINTMFVAAPIPGTLYMLFQNTVYRNFLLERLRLRRKKRSAVFPSRCNGPTVLPGLATK